MKFNSKILLLALSVAVGLVLAVDDGSGHRNRLLSNSSITNSKTTKTQRLSTSFDDLNDKPVVSHTPNSQARQLHQKKSPGRGLKLVIDQPEYLDNVSALVQGKKIQKRNLVDKKDVETETKQALEAQEVNNQKGNLGGDNSSYVLKFSTFSVYASILEAENDSGLYIRISSANLNDQNLIIGEYPDSLCVNEMKIIDDIKKPEEEELTLAIQAKQDGLSEATKDQIKLFISEAVEKVRVFNEHNNQNICKAIEETKLVVGASCGPSSKVKDMSVTYLKVEKQGQKTSFIIKEDAEGNVAIRSSDMVSLDITTNKASVIQNKDGFRDKIIEMINTAALRMDEATAAETIKNKLKDGCKAQINISESHSFELKRSDFAAESPGCILKDYDLSGTLNHISFINFMQIKVDNDFLNQESKVSMYPDNLGSQLDTFIAGLKENNEILKVKGDGKEQYTVALKGLIPEGDRNKLKCTGPPEGNEYSCTTTNFGKNRDVLTIKLKNNTWLIKMKMPILVTPLKNYHPLISLKLINSFDQVKGSKKSITDFLDAIQSDPNCGKNN